jgi:lysozyme
MEKKTQRRLAAGVLVVSALGVGTITQWEGFEPTAYKDIVGVKTIGYGSTKGVKAGDTITEPEARKRLEQEIKDEYQAAVHRCIRVPLHQYEFDAFVSLAYNIGGTRFCSSTLVKRANERDYGSACAEILRWNRAGGRVVQGLVNRRRDEYNMCIGAK